MKFSQQIEQQLSTLIGLAPGSLQVVAFSNADNIRLEIDFTAVDMMGCSLKELRLNVPTLQSADAQTLKQWADAFCLRVTYLLENLGPLEIDSNQAQVLIRSTPPDTSGPATQYYEIQLYSQANGNFSLSRYLVQQGQPGRNQVEMQLTHEVLKKLVDDLVDTIPVSN